MTTYLQSPMIIAASDATASEKAAARASGGIILTGTAATDTASIQAINDAVTTSGFPEVRMLGKTFNIEGVLIIDKIHLRGNGSEPENCFDGYNGQVLNLTTTTSGIKIRQTTNNGGKLSNCSIWVGVDAYTGTALQIGDTDYSVNSITDIIDNISIRSKYHHGTALKQYVNAATADSYQMLVTMGKIYITYFQYGFVQSVGSSAGGLCFINGIHIQSLHIDDTEYPVILTDSNDTTIDHYILQPDGYADSVSSHLESGIDTDDTSFTLHTGDGASFPSEDFYVKINAEYIYVSSRTGDVCTCTRDSLKGDSTNSSHSANDTVTLFQFCKYGAWIDDSSYNKILSFMAWDWQWASGPPLLISGESDHNYVLLNGGEWADQEDGLYKDESGGANNIIVNISRGSIDSSYLFSKNVFQSDASTQACRSIHGLEDAVVLLTFDDASSSSYKNRANKSKFISNAWANNATSTITQGSGVVRRTAMGTSTNHWILSYSGNEAFVGESWTWFVNYVPNHDGSEDTFRSILMWANSSNNRIELAKYGVSSSYKFLLEWKVTQQSYDTYHDLGTISFVSGEFLSFAVSYDATNEILDVIVGGEHILHATDVPNQEGADPATGFTVGGDNSNPCSGYIYAPVACVMRHMGVEQIREIQKDMLRISGETKPTSLAGSGEMIYVKQVIDHADITDEGGATGYIEFSEVIPKFSIAQSIKIDYITAFDSTAMVSLLMKIRTTATSDTDAFNKTDGGESIHGVTTDVIWSGKDCQNPNITGQGVFKLEFIHDSDITDIISGAGAQGTLEITAVFMKV